MQQEELARALRAYWSTPELVPLRDELRRIVYAVQPEEDEEAILREADEAGKLSIDWTSYRENWARLNFLVTGHCNVDPTVEAKATLKRLIADPDRWDGKSCQWDWDTGTWRWEICLRYAECDPDDDPDAGYVAIEAVQDGKPLPYGTYPVADHSEWTVEFVGPHSVTFNIKGKMLSEVKGMLDSTLGAPTPDILATY